MSNDSNTNEWKVICRVEDIPVLGARRVARPVGVDVAVFRNAEDQVFALLDRCPHKGGPSEPGHRVRHQRGLPAAQLGHRPGRRLRQVAR